MTRICKVSNKERLNAIPILLPGDALVYYSCNVQSCKTYDEAVKALQNCYNNTVNRARNLTKWWSPQLAEKVSNNPDTSEVEILRRFVARLMSLQKQLTRVITTTKFLRDPLMTAVDIPSVQVVLRDRIICTTQQLANRIANFLSDIPKTAGFLLAHYAPFEQFQISNQAFYTLR